MNQQLKTTIEYHLERIASSLRQNSATRYGRFKIGTDNTLSVLWRATLSSFGTSIVKFDVNVVNADKAPVFQGVYISE